MNSHFALGSVCFADSGKSSAGNILPFEII